MALVPTPATSRTRPVPQTPTLGAVESADIAVPDHARMLRFYARVLTTGAAPLWREDLASHSGLPVIGLGEQSPAYSMLPLQWMPHIQVGDVAASVARAVERGAEELLHGRSEAGESQWAVLRDPFGAAFGLIPASPAGTPAPSDAPRTGPDRGGCILQISLATTAPERAVAFYTAVVGWTARTRLDVVSLHRWDGRAVARIERPGPALAGRPTAWQLHLPVGGLGQSLAQVDEEGGTVLRRAGASAESPAWACVADPLGISVVIVDSSGVA